MAQKCTNCNGMLSYDKLSQKMYCDKCLIFYEMENTEVKQLNNVKARGKFFYTEIYKCPNCKSEIKMSDTDFGRKCIFCGELTVPVKGNVEASIMEENDYASRMKPDYILPFAVTEEEAREKAKLVWSGVKDKKFKIFNAKPVYLPYALYDTSVNNENLYSNLYGDIHNNLHGKEAEKEIARSEKVPVIVSDKYIDENIFKIEKFNLEYLVEFDETKIVHYYTELLGDETEIYKCVKRDFKYGFSNNNLTKIHKVEYAIFPFWIVVVEYQNRKYTTLVNGQNGQFIGDSVHSKFEMGENSEKILAFFSIFLSVIIYAMNRITLISSSMILIGIIAFVVLCAISVFFRAEVWHNFLGIKDCSLIYNDDFYNKHILKKSELLTPSPKDHEPLTPSPKSHFQQKNTKN